MVLFVVGLHFLIGSNLSSGYTVITRKREQNTKKTSKPMFFQTQNAENKGKKEDTLYV